MIRAMKTQHPYIVAEQAYKAGEMHSTTAIGMVARDREFIAECELSSHAVLETARAIVLGTWTAERIASIKEA